LNGPKNGEAYSGGGDKTIVMGAMQIGGVVVTQIIPDREADTLIPVLKEMVEEGSILVTDELKGYYRAKDNFFHIQINHNEGEYVHNAFSTNNIEGFWSLLKRSIIGIYHNVSPQHLQAYCNETAYRYNTRNSTCPERFESTMNRLEGKRLKYDVLIRKQ